MRKLISIVWGAIIAFLLFPSSIVYAEYFLVYGQPAPVANMYDSGNCGCRVRQRIHRRCPPVRPAHRRPCVRRPACRPACNARPRCDSRPACSCVSVQYFCPPPRPCCGAGIPLDESYAGGCGRIYGGGCGGGVASSGYWQTASADPGVYFAQPPDYFEREETPCYSCNYDLSTADDDPCAYPDMQINW